MAKQYIPKEMVFFYGRWFKSNGCSFPWPWFIYSYRC